MVNKKFTLNELRSIVKHIIKEERMDYNAILSNAMNMGYGDIKKQLMANGDVDFKSLIKKGYCSWDTDKLGEIDIYLDMGNICQIKCQSERGYMGKFKTYDCDEDGLASCFIAAMNALIKDYKSTFRNE